MKKSELNHKCIRLFVIAVLIAITLLVLYFGMYKHIVPNTVTQETTCIHNSELFSRYGDKLVVFSLYESPILQYASNIWNHSFTQKVVCLCADDCWGQGNWNYNQVRQEIESSIYQGTGPDLLMIDNLGYLGSGLPITTSPSLFQDITNICEQESLYSNIAHLYTNNEKTYAIPLRIIVPTVGGRDLEAITSANNLDVLSLNVFKKEPLNGIELYQKIASGLNIPKSEIVFNSAEALPELYYPIWRNYIKTDAASSKDKYQNLIKILQKIAEYNNLLFQEKSNENPSNNSPTNFMNSDSVVFCDLIIRSDNFIIPFYDFINNNHRNGYIDFISSPDEIKYCIPSSVIALPSNANERGKEFLLFLLSDDVQSAILGDGLPVNYLAFDKNITDASTTYNVSLCNNILSDLSVLVPIADIDSLKEETTTFSEIFQRYCLEQISLETAYNLYEMAL